MIKKLLKSKSFTVLLHFSVWIIIFILPLLFERPHNLPPKMDIEPKIDGMFQLMSTLFGISFIPLFYLNAYYLVPKYLNKKKWYNYILFISVCIAAITLINIALGYVFIGQIPPVPIRIVIFLTTMILITSTAFSFIQQNFKDEKLRKEKEAENLKTELLFLRSQINPHFLFNTLNNLVSLARKKSDLLEPSLLKLSGLMHYMLYESDDEKISIHKEIEYLNNYIELQKLRFSENVSISFLKVVQPTSNVEIVPMILISFVENAFKHGVILVQDPQIDICLVVTGNLLSFSVKNKCNFDKLEEKDKTSGIGLNNVKRRLNLLCPDSRLEIIEKDNWHIINLSIILP